MDDRVILRVGAKILIPFIMLLFAPGIQPREQQTAFFRHRRPTPLGQITRLQHQLGAPFTGAEVSNSRTFDSMIR